MFRYYNLIRCFLVALTSFVFLPVFSQLQSCPANINFSLGSLTNWFAYTGNNKGGNGPSAVKDTFSSYLAAPVGTIGASTIYEYQLPSVPGISVNTAGGTDVYGGFSKIPIINGYHYNYSILLGSTSITLSNSNSNAGGYIRGISYKINVPAGPATIPYTMTYAYAMVLENGAHNSDEQPLFSATLRTKDSVISCASPAYYLPTFNNANRSGGMATLDTAGALQQGFRPSAQASPNPNPNPTSPNDTQHLFDVWAKGWTEVTFDLSPYRGQQVILTFEADNCVPGGHFAYAYVALRNTCGGLVISGDSVACDNSTLTYSIPALGGASYQWAVPNSWTIISGGSTNIITIAASSTGGTITAKEENSCANLQTSIPVTTVAPPVGGDVSGDATVCEGNNTSTLSLTGQSGNIIDWVSSLDGINWTDIPDVTTTYAAQNLTATTLYKAVVETNVACPIDSSSIATITVDQKSVGGTLNPANSSFCAGQDRYSILTLAGNTGKVVNWQSSQDDISWVNFNPLNTDSSYNVTGLTSSTLYRTIVKNGVCVADTSAIASIKFYNVAFPQATISPADTSICFGGSAQLNATINIGTSYTWANYGSLSGASSGAISATPFSITTTATPGATANYVLNVENEGCPNLLMDTFHVNVVPPFTVSAGDDTLVVINQPLQLQAISTDITSNTFTWLPATDLSNPSIANPVAIFNEVTTATYTVKGIDATGCSATGTITVKVYNLPPDLYVPTAFTPNGDGLNDIFKPILIGMKSLTLFRIYNRWGQLVFSTSNAGVGWDGTFNGSPQGNGTYVWIADGVSYEGVNIQKKGNVVLIR